MTDMPTEIPEPAPHDPNGPLVPGFAKIPERFWADRVRRAQKTPKPLATKDDDGLDVRWLYSQDDELSQDPGGLPGRAPFVRGTRVGTAWDLRQEHTHPVVRTANAQVLEDLVGGVTSFTLRFDQAARLAVDPADDAFLTQRGRGGIAISGVDCLDAVLEGVYLDLAPVALDAGPAAIAAAALLRAVWERRELDLDTIQSSFGIDPLGTLAAEGHLLASPEAAVAVAGRIAAQTFAETPNVQALRVDTGAYVEAGASPALELAIAAATGAAYLRSAVAAGLTPAQAATQIEFSLTTGPVQFQEIAKLRAMRRIWARILEASGVPAADRHSRTYARTTDRMLSRVDPWTNMLRGTTSLFAAAVGGADGATVSSFDRLLGQPSTLGRRIARNTQLILLEESGLARVADPAGGSYYVEARSDEVAKAAWTQLQQLESEGGIHAALASGRLTEQLAGLAAARRDELVRRKRELVGVNTFPLLGDEGLEPEAPIDLDALATRDRAVRLERGASDAAATLSAAGSEPTLAELVAAAESGARIDELAAAVGIDRHTATPLPSERDAAPFEALRETALEQAPAGAEDAPAVDAAGADAPPAEAPAVGPQVLLAPIGPLAATVTPVTWARNFLAVGGLEAVLPPEGTDPVELARSGGHKLVVLCPGKGVEDDATAAVAAELRNAGAERIVLALGKDAQLEATGADVAVRDGIDMVAALTDLQQFLSTKGQA